MLAPIHRNLVVSHLDDCDFCWAELQLLERFPADPEIVALTEMPPSLRALAESILGTARRTLPRDLFESRVIGN